MKGAETDYTKLEDKLRKQIDRIETDHPGYDEYRYNLADVYKRQSLNRSQIGSRA